MVSKCPNCGTEIYHIEENKELICVNCGTISSTEKTIQIGLTEYKFKDNGYEYTHVFESEEELTDFTKYVKKNKDEYSYVDMLIYVNKQLTEIHLI